MEWKSKNTRIEELEKRQKSIYYLKNCNENESIRKKFASVCCKSTSCQRREFSRVKPIMKWNIERKNAITIN